jgi:hypothetical protein
MLNNKKIILYVVIYTIISSIGYYFDYKLSAILNISKIDEEAIKIFIIRNLIYILSTNILVFFILNIECDLKELSKNYKNLNNIDLNFTLSNQVAPMYFGTILRISGELIPATFLLIYYTLFISQVLKIDNNLIILIFIIVTIYFLISKILSNKASQTTKIFLSFFKSYLSIWKDIKYLSKKQIDFTNLNKKKIISKYIFWNVMSIANANSTRTYVEVVILSLIYFNILDFNGGGGIYIMYRVGATYLNGFSYVTNILHYYSQYNIMKNINLLEKNLEN